MGVKPSHSKSLSVKAVLRNREGDLEELGAAYLFSVEGAHSTARHLLGLPSEGKSHDQSYVLADCHLDPSSPSSAWPPSMTVGSATDAKIVQP